MASGAGIRTVCGALIAAIGIGLGISGAVADDLVGSEEIGGSDAGNFASMVTEGGRVLWSRQPGTFADDFANDVATDKDGNVYVVGSTIFSRSQGVWVIKFDGNGHRLWSWQPGTAFRDSAAGVATDRDGNVYVVGITFSSLGGPNKGGFDGWVIKFDGDGRRLWSRQPGTSERDSAAGVATDRDGNVYVVGYTLGALGGPNEGSLDGWVIKFDGDGHWLWSRQPGTSNDDFAAGVATDMEGNVFVAGGTGGALGGPNKGSFDGWVIKFDGDGNRLWTRQPGTSSDDLAAGVATDQDGNVSVVGETSGALGGHLGGERTTRG